MTHSGKSAVVIGGGLAGLCAATLLSKKGYKVTLIEQKSRLGGRTFSFRDRVTNDVIDNGQHIMMGCYRYTLKWLKQMGQNVDELFVKSFRFNFIEPGRTLHSLVIPQLFHPFHLIAGIWAFGNLTLDERLSLIKIGLTLPVERISQNISVNEWLHDRSQSQNAITYFWEPVCIAVMNASPEHASANLFAEALKKMFLGGRNDSGVLIPKKGLTELFVKSADDFIRRNGGSIFLNAETESFIVEGQRINGVEIKGRETITADIYICAVPPPALAKLLPGMINKENYNFSTILSVYLWLTGIHTDQLFDGSFVGCIDTRIHWIFKKSDRLLEITVSDAGELREWKKDKIMEIVSTDLQSLFHKFKPACVTHFQVIKERFATFNPAIGAKGRGPDCRTAFRNLFLAGDWTDTGLPSTIESAVKSGYAAVECISGSA